MCVCVCVCACVNSVTVDWSGIPFGTPNCAPSVYDDNGRMLQLHIEVVRARVVVDAECVFLLVTDARTISA